MRASVRPSAIAAMILALMAASLAASADPARIAACDRLVAERKYLSAYQSLGPTSEDDEAAIAKRVELCINYFAQSIDHRIFAFADLKEGESLGALRGGTGSFSMFAFDPAAAVADFEKAHGPSPVLEKALGDYYYDVLLRYGGRWLESDEAIVARIVVSYEAAFAAGLSDALSLANCAEGYLRRGGAEKAAAYYARSFELGMDSANAHYNAAYAYLSSGGYSAALSHARRAIELYADDPGYRFDALLLASDAAKGSGDAPGALAFLDEARKISAGDYRLYKKSIPLYLSSGRSTDALRDAQTLFALAPRNPSASQMVMEAYYGAKKNDELAAFFESGLKSYFGDPEALGNLYYHYSQLAHATKDNALALDLLDKAERSFRKAGKADQQVYDAIAKQRESFGE
jgi:hypothetical protein